MDKRATIKMPVAGVLAGDTYIQDGMGLWTALGDADEREDGSVVVVVQFSDGGISTRVWGNGDVELDISRALTGPRGGVS